MVKQEDLIEMVCEGVGWCLIVANMDWCVLYQVTLSIAAELL